MDLVLASASPRRLQLLQSVGIEPRVQPAGVDETRLADEAPLTYAQRISRAKAAAVQGPLVLAADTIVHLEDRLFGKPAGLDDAAEMLRELSGRTHSVTTAWSLRGHGVDQTSHCTTAVTFRALSDEDIAGYLAHDESLDKAGAYAVQGHGATLVARIEGCLTNVIGLPVPDVLALLSKLEER